MGEPIIVGIDSASWPDMASMTLMRVMDNSRFEIEEVFSIPSALITASYNSTAIEILMRQTAGENIITLMISRAGEAFARSLFKMMPKRKRWDQFGAYHKRMMKKFLKQPLRFA